MVHVYHRSTEDTSQETLKQHVHSSVVLRCTVHEYIYVLKHLKQMYYDVRIIHIYICHVCTTYVRIFSNIRF